MEFTDFEIRIAMLLRSGKSTGEVAEIIGKSKRTIQRLKKKEGFEELIGEIQVNDPQVVESVNYAVKESKPDLIKQVIAEIVGDELEPIIEDVKKEYLQWSTNLKQTSALLLNKTLEKLHSLKSDEISIRSIPGLLKTVQILLEMGIKIDKEFIFKEIDQGVHVVVDFNDDSLPEGYEGHLEESEDVAETL